jgi:CDP-paratose 2-epimerase
MSRPPLRVMSGSRPVLVTGGAGFLGCNIAHRLAAEGREVRILDSLARPGVEANLAWLKERHKGRIAVLLADVRDGAAVQEAASGVEAVLHLAAQVAVTTSLADPIHDFEVNARGTLNLLEALREQREPPPLLFASTNKVYGKLHGAENLRRDDTRWQPTDGLAAHGCGENTPLDFYSPYGCSKGVADQYVLDYARVFGLPTLVLRMSCLYGPRQFGTEDQGWIAHFLIRALNGDPLTVFGDGRQVRDALFVDDAVAAWLAAWRGIDQLSGRAFNLGGGPENTLSLLELLERIPTLTGRRPEVSYAPARPGDQLWYVSDTRALSEATDWRPRTGLDQGLERLVAWLAVHVAGEADRRREVPA